jgi:hypothetical protein
VLVVVARMRFLMAGMVAVGMLVGVEVGGFDVAGTVVGVGAGVAAGPQEDNTRVVKRNKDKTYIEMHFIVLLS